MPNQLHAICETRSSARPFILGSRSATCECNALYMSDKTAHGVDADANVEVGET
jgi:hypothetical protein